MAAQVTFAYDGKIQSEYKTKLEDLLKAKSGNPNFVLNSVSAGTIPSEGLGKEVKEFAFLIVTMDQLSSGGDKATIAQCMTYLRQKDKLSDWAQNWKPEANEFSAVAAASKARVSKNELAIELAAFDEEEPNQAPAVKVV